MLDKRETMIEGFFHIQGTARLLCDRCLEPFDYPMDIEQRIVFKYGQEEKELSDEIVIISRDHATLDVGQYLYELIGVNVPMKRLHPKYQRGGQEEGDAPLVYSSAATGQDSQEDAIDPRWEKLKKLK